MRSIFRRISFNRPLTIIKWFGSSYFPHGSLSCPSSSVFCFSSERWYHWFDPWWSTGGRLQFSMLHC
jgi:hypothetical protein